MTAKKVASKAKTTTKSNSSSRSTTKTTGQTARGVKDQKVQDQKSGPKVNLDLRKVAIGVGLGLILTSVFLLELTSVLDFVLIRWEFMIPPIIAVYYLSVQPYLNYADHWTYFKTGALFGALLGLVVILINLIYELSFFGELQLVENFAPTFVAYQLFVLAYAAVAGIGHYLFNINVDPEKRDIKKNQFIGLALVVGAFTFVVIAILESYLEPAVDNAILSIFVPVIIASFTVVKLHHLEPKAFYKGTVLGSLTGLIMGLVQSLITAVILFFQVATNENYLESISASAGGSINFTFVLIPLLIVIYTILGGFTGLTMKVLKTLL